jgi:predicted heme/steroid binding protein
LTLTFSYISFAQNQTFTLTELSKYNGKNGAKAYVAVNGKVYDVSGIGSWSGGKHFCPGALAGKDITALWKISPHYSKTNFLSRFPVVGTLTSEQVKRPAAPVPVQPKTPPGPGLPSQKRNLLSRPVLLIIALILGVSVIWFILRTRHK